MNPNDARISRIYTRRTGIDVPDETPNIDPTTGVISTIFEVVVEAISGDLQANSGMAYTLTLVAQDVSAGSAAPAAFAHATAGESFILVQAGLASNWPAYKEVFSINISAAGAYTPNHIYKYYATLVSFNHFIVSSAASELFMLF